MRKEIEKLYYQFEHLEDNYVDFDETIERRTELENYLEEQKGKSITDELIRDIEPFYASLCAEYEKQGFIYGFEYAVKLFVTGQKMEVREHEG